MRRLLVLLLISCIGALVSAQHADNAITFSVVQNIGDQLLTGRAHISGKVALHGAIVHCDGGCQLTGDYIKLEADELEYDQESGVASACGKVSMTFLGVQHRPKQ